jgi:hypothetical protein
MVSGTLSAGRTVLVRTARGTNTGGQPVGAVFVLERQ